MNPILTRPLPKWTTYDLRLDQSTDTSTGLPLYRPGINWFNTIITFFAHVCVYIISITKVSNLKYVRNYNHKKNRTHSLFSKKSFHSRQCVRLFIILFRIVCPPLILLFLFDLLGFAYKLRQLAPKPREQRVSLCLSVVRNGEFNSILWVKHRGQDAFSWVGDMAGPPWCRRQCRHHRH